MLTVSFIVIVLNKADFISNVITSLKEIKGDFRKQFIFIDNGSSDNSLELIKKLSVSLPYTTILSLKKSDKALALKNAINLSYGNYIHFLEGDNLVAPEGTSKLLYLLTKYHSKVAIGLKGKYEISSKNLISSHKEKPNEQVILDPLQALLQEKTPFTKNLCSANCLIEKDLLKKIIKEDYLAFNQKFSLALKCAAHSSFIYYPKTLSYSPVIPKKPFPLEKKLESFNTIIALKHFIEVSPDIAEKYKFELYKKLYSTLLSLDKKNVFILPHYLLIRYLAPQFTLLELKSVIKNKIKRFFQDFSTSPLEAKNL